MSYTKFLAALAVCLFTFGFTSSARAEKDPKCMARCQLKDQAAQPPCFAACPEMVAKPPTTATTPTSTATQPPPRTKVCPGGKVVPIDQDCPVKEGPKTKVCWDKSVIPVEKDCPPQKGGDPKCGANEVVKDGGCVCAEGFEKICNACVAVCPEGQIHDGTGKCVEVGGTCEDPCEGAAADRAEIKKLISAADYFWLLVAILLGVLGHFGWHLWLVYGRNGKDDKETKAKPASAPAPQSPSGDEPLFGAVATEDEFEADDEPEPAPEPAPRPRRRPRPQS